MSPHSHPLLTEVYGHFVENIDIASLARALESWYFDHPGSHFLHPCLIEGRPALVCQAGLSREHQQAFTELQQIAERYRLFLKEDSRQREALGFLNNRRRNVSIVLSFCLSMIASSRVVTAEELKIDVATTAMASLPAEPMTRLRASESVDSHGQKVIRLRQSTPPTAAEVMAAYSEKQTTLTSKPSDQTLIGDFLRNAYQAEAGDPNYIMDDIAAIAGYYAHYPAVTSLFGELREHKLVLKYRHNTWQSQAWGTQTTVDSVTIYFDTRLGAQLLNDPGCEATPACSISPADALLHELLHAKLMLLDSDHFIASGGMAHTLYPFAHEHEVITHENRLYSDMNQVDGRARPIRHRHSGELLTVSCPACTPTKQIASTESSL